jgi:hypothetical protein
LQLIYDDTNITIHHISKDKSYLSDLQKIELATGSPLSFNDPNFQKLKTTWISDPGLHLGIDKYDNSVVFACRIT